MARWLVVRGNTDGRVRIYYENLVSNQRHDLGWVEENVTDDEILKWIYEEASPAYGDRICLSDGTSFMYQPPRKSASMN